MWRPWCNTSNTSEENIQVVPETDENHVEETSDKSTNPQHPDPLIVIPETEESASTSTKIYIYINNKIFCNVQNLCSISICNHSTMNKLVRYNYYLLYYKLEKPSKYLHL